MRRAHVGLMVSVLSLAFVACGENQVTVGGEGTPKVDTEVEKAELTHGTRVHTMPWRDPNALQVQAAPAGAHLNYYGGKVISNVQVVQVNWGSTVNTTISSGMPGFYTAITSAPTFWDWIANEYKTTGLNGVDGAPGSNQGFGRGTFLSTVTITPTNTSAALTDAQIQTEINSKIAAGTLPAPTDNVIYMINFPLGKSITDPSGGKSCVGGGFCAYHGTFKRGSQNVIYGVLPSNEPGSGCNTGCGGSANFFDNYTSVASHELVEAATDAEIGLTATVGRPIAWYDPSNGEIGDICNAQQGTITAASGTVYTVQAEFSNVSNNCIVNKTTTPTSDFSISMTPASATVAAGSTASFTVSTAVTSGTPGTVSLSVSGLPSGVTGSFSPASVAAGGTSTLTLTAAATAASATATFTVTGTATSATHTVSGSLTVTGTTSGETVIANGQIITGQSGALNQQTFYRVDVPAGVNLTISTSGGTGDADLYVRFGSRPTTATYDCRPFISGNSESCNVASTQAGSYFIMLNGFAAYSGLSITANWTTVAGDPTLVRGVPVSGISGASGSQQFWQIDIPAGTASLVVKIAGGTGDADLYLRSGAHPTTATYNCRPFITGNNETCTITNPAAGKWYVMIRGFTAYSGVTLSAN
jgi:serine protease